MGENAEKKYHWLLIEFKIFHTFENVTYSNSILVENVCFYGGRLLGYTCI